jgi:hypothetical protein
MNRFLIVVSFLLLASAIPLHAGVITDPGIGIDDPPNCTSGTPEFGAFTFSSNSMGGGFSCFVNGNTDDIISVDIETFGNFFTDNCSVGSNIVGYSNAFDLCSVTYFPEANVTDISFSETPAILSIAPGAVFEVDLNDSQFCKPQLSSMGGSCFDSGPQVGGWGPDRFFAAETNLSPTPPLQPFLTPEPSTISLFGVGMLGLGLLVMKRNKKSGQALRVL